MGGHTDGRGVAARLNQPMGLAFDRQGNLYVADAASHVVRRITPAGVVSTLVGIPGQAGRTDGPAGHLSHPGAVAVGPDGTVYVLDCGNETIRAVR